MATSKKKSRVDELERENGTELNKDGENQAEISMGEEYNMDQDDEESSDSESEDDSEEMEIEEVSKPRNSNSLSKPTFSSSTKHNMHTCDIIINKYHKLLESITDLKLQRSVTVSVVDGSLLIESFCFQIKAR